MLFSSRLCITTQAGCLALHVLARARGAHGAKSLVLVIVVVFQSDDFGRHQASSDEAGDSIEPNKFALC